MQTGSLCSAQTGLQSGFTIPPSLANSKEVAADTRSHPFQQSSLRIPTIWLTAFVIAPDILRHVHARRPKQRNAVPSFLQLDGAFDAAIQWRLTSRVSAQVSHLQQRYLQRSLVFKETSDDIASLMRSKKVF